VSSDDKKAPAGADATRTVHYYALLIGVIGCVNLWIYWVQASKWSLVLAVVCFVCVVAWLIFARRFVR
jgi:membrane protein YdbS with pleckstrin-like domain